MGAALRASRTPAALPSGYRAYAVEDVELLRRAVPTASAACRSRPRSSARSESAGVTDRPSIFGALIALRAPARDRSAGQAGAAGAQPRIEDETLAHAAAPLCFGAFQSERFYRGSSTATGAWPSRPTRPSCSPTSRGAPGAGAPAEIPVEPRRRDQQRVGRGGRRTRLRRLPAGLGAPEPRHDRAGPDEGERRFEALWTIDPEAVRRASLAAARLAGRADEGSASGSTSCWPTGRSRWRPPAPALTALTNRMIGYLERNGDEQSS